MTKHSQKIVSKQGSRLPIWMLLITIVGVAVIVVTLVTSNNTAPAAQSTIEVRGSPALKVDKEKVDFGNVQLGQTVEVKFEVTNVGDQLLRFKEAPYVEVVEGC